MQVGNIVFKIFKKNDTYSEKKGLAVSLEELMEQRTNVITLRKNKLISSNKSGNVKSAFKGRGMEMEEIRAYANGDDVRDIDWRVSARKNNPYTKLYAEEKDREIYILLNLSSPMFFGSKKELKSVTAGKVAALLGFMAAENKDRLGALVFDGKDAFMFKPENNRAHLLAFLKKISQISRSMLDKRHNNDSLTVPLQMLSQNIKSRSTVFIISDFNNFDDEEKKLLAMLAKKSRVFCINVFDVLEETAPKDGEYMAEHNGQSLVFSTYFKKFRQEYQIYFAQKRDNIKEFCKRFGCRYIEIRTDIPLHKQLDL